MTTNQMEMEKKLSIAIGIRSQQPRFLEKTDPSSAARARHRPPSDPLNHAMQGVRDTRTAHNLFATKFNFFNNFCNEIVFSERIFIFEPPRRSGSPPFASGQAHSHRSCWPGKMKFRNENN